MILLQPTTLAALVTLTGFVNAYVSILIIEVSKDELVMKINEFDETAKDRCRQEASQLPKTLKLVLYTLPW
ncbi:unnamed protein product [Dicrocoelium dendriticum]|nr:unnamed protein product [Dicrocoelium dendriticum]